MIKINTQKALLAIFGAYLFLLPLVFSPYNSELFEFNKTLLTYAAAALVFGVWIWRMGQQRRFIFRPTPFFWPLIFFFLSQAISTVLSIHPYTSFWGYYSRFHQGLLSTIAYLILFWGLVSNLDRRAIQPLLRLLLAGLALSAGWGFLEHFGIDKTYWIQDVQSRVFSTFGQPNWLAAALAAGFFLIFCPNTISRRWRPWLAGLFIIVIYFTKSRSGLVGLLAGFFLFFLALVLARPRKFLRELKSQRLIVGLFVITLFLLALNRNLFAFLKPHPPGPANSHLLITPSSKIREIVWQGALTLWRRYPIFGTGSETFAYSYYWVRPVAHNLTSEWDFLYNKAHNEYLNFAANNGTVGLVCYLLFPSAFFLYLWRRRRQNFAPYLAASFTTILVSNFFGFSVTPVAIIFYLIPALAFLIEVNPQEATAAAIPGKHFWLGALLILFSLWQIGNYWRADYFYARAKKDRQERHFLQALTDAQKAVRLRPHQAIYWSRLGDELAALAFLTHQASPSSQNWQTFAQEATAAAQRSLKLNPVHLNIYKEAARTYYLLASADPRYLAESRTILEAATNLAPTDAKLYYNIGRIYFIENKNDLAERYLKKAIQLKLNYEAARWELAKLYQEEKKPKLARQQLEFILQRINPASSPAAKLLKELETR